MRARADRLWPAMTRDFDALPRLLASVFPGASLLAEAAPLRGGLEAAVARLRIHHEGAQRHVVVKRLTHVMRRESERYRVVGGAGVTPALFGVVEDGDSTYLFLEHVRPAQSWPWRDSANTRRVLEQLARVHLLHAEAAMADDWDYEEELRASAAETLSIARDSVASSELRPLRRVCASLDLVRQGMKNALGTTLIHGDVHSGNVVLRGSGQVVFLDWARSRAGSPLEDLSSWLLSLRAWEPAAARDHDSLVRAYLSAADLPAQITAELRDAYWFAAASNALAGALRHHLVVARTGSGRKRASAIAQARAALRDIRRADERLPRT